VNPNDQSYVNIDALLSSTLSSKTDTEPLEFLKRDELTQRLVNKMQAWYELSVDGKEPVMKSVSVLQSDLQILTNNPSSMKQERFTEGDIGRGEAKAGIQSFNAHHEFRAIFDQR